MLSRLFRLMHAVNESFALAVFWLYVLMFLVAFSLIFVFPPGALLLVFAGLGGLGVAVVVGQALRWCQRCLARAILRGGSCPHCAEPDHGATAGSTWRCPQCGSAFLGSGAVHDPQVHGAPA